MCKNVLEVHYQQAEVGGTWTSHANRGAKNVVFCLSVSVTHLNDKVSENNFAQKALELKSGFAIVG